uniref:Uncharacterized protein n=1 Tax=Quercus lobata TaxID=97700 RepID=A0A7N2KPP9_QUELO
MLRLAMGRLAKEKRWAAASEPGNDEQVSPLSTVDSASFSKLATQNSLLTHLPTFCSSANLLCFPDLAPSLEKHDKDSNFARYTDQNFTNYNTDWLDGANSFKTHSRDRNLPMDSFRRYSRDSTGHKDKFNNHPSNGNVVDQGFNGYATGSTGRSSEFAKSDSVNAGTSEMVLLTLFCQSFCRDRPPRSKPPRSLSLSHSNAPCTLS